MQTYKHCQHKIGLEIRIYLGVSKLISVLLLSWSKIIILTDMLKWRIGCDCNRICDCRGFREAEFGVNAASS